MPEPSSHGDVAVPTTKLDKNKASRRPNSLICVSLNVEVTGGTPWLGSLSLRYDVYALSTYPRTSLINRKGALCVMALMFNVCALVKGWQQIVSADGSIFELRTPSW